MPTGEGFIAHNGDFDFFVLHGAPCMCSKDAIICALRLAERFHALALTPWLLICAPSERLTNGPMRLDRVRAYL